jgi:hypothetical protein
LDGQWQNNLPLGFKTGVVITLDKSSWIASSSKIFVAVNGSQTGAAYNMIDLMESGNTRL